MRHVSHALQSLLAPTVNALGFELLGALYIRSNQTNTLRLYIDQENGVNVDDCAKVSHQVSGVLDVESPISEAFSLEVSSPGIERPLFTLAHFQQFIGHDVKIWLNQKLNGRVKVTGKINKIDDDNVYITEAEDVFCIPLDRIDKAKLAAVF